MQSYFQRLGVYFVLCLAILLLMPCTVHAVEVIQGPTLTMNPTSWTPDAGVVEFETDEPVGALLTITDGNDFWRVAFPELLQQHYLPVLGLKPDRTYTVDVDLLSGGRIGTFFATTPPLPADFPAILVRVSDPGNMEPGLTLIDCISRGRGAPGGRYTTIVNSAGEVVWYSTKCMTAGRQLPNGNISYRVNAEARELDMLGNEIKEDPVGGTFGMLLDFPGIALHHDLLKTPHGTFLSVDRQSVDVDSYPSSETDPDAPAGPTTLRDDSVVEFFPDGTLRREWPLIDLIDPMRIAYSALSPTPDGLDWTHANAVNYNLAEDSIIVSVRHQDAVISFSRETGELEWILGPHDNWAPRFQPFLLHPIGLPFRWQFHQHAPMWTGSGTIMLFDNGNNRASPFDGTTPVPADQSFSRGVEFEIDQDAMTVRQVWEYGENIEEQIYASFISDADWMKTTGNRLVAFGGTSYVGGVPAFDLGLGERFTRIIEVTDMNVPVFDIQLTDVEGVSWMTSYRSERIAGLYPLASSPGDDPMIVDFFQSPNGVGETLRVTKSSGVTELFWLPPLSGAEYDAVDYYVVYVSSSANDGFTMFESTINESVPLGSGAEPVLFYKVVTANVKGTSGDEPAP